MDLQHWQRVSQKSQGLLLPGSRALSISDILVKSLKKSRLTLFWYILAYTALDNKKHFQSKHLGIKYACDQECSMFIYFTVMYFLTLNKLTNFIPTITNFNDWSSKFVLTIRAFLNTTYFLVLAISNKLIKMIIELFLVWFHLRLLNELKCKKLCLWFFSILSNVWYRHILYMLFMYVMPCFFLS